MRGTTTMNMSACVGLKETLAANRPGGNNHDSYPLNQFIGKSFFEDENYRSALERLDGGYEVSMDLIEWMQDYCDNEREQARNLIAYVDKWTTRLKQQPTIVSYHTTKRAQLDVVRISKEVARLKESTCVEIQKVIDKYRNYVNETYTTERFRAGRRHHRTQEFKKSFKSAHTSVREVSNELEHLYTQEKKAREAVLSADSAYEDIELDPTASEKQRQRAKETQTKKHTILNDIEEKIQQVKDRLKLAQKSYRQKATEIFQQCQYVEEERLEQIRETLLDFIQAIYTQKYAMELNEIFDGLTKKVTTQQDSFEDLLFWAKTYGIENKLTKSLKLSSKGSKNDEDEENVNEHRTSTKKSIKNEVEKLHQSDDEEPSAATTNTTPGKTKLKRRKSTTNNDKKTTNANEPSTINHTVLNHV